MARAQFDRHEVIEQSQQLFWQNGFSGSSMQQVFQATGLKPGSIYLAFGSKEGLYKEALIAYGKKSLADITRTVDESPSIMDGICHILEKMVNDSAKKNYCSCFLVKSQLELASESFELHQLASEQLQQIEGVYKAYLLKDGVKPDIAESRARSIMLHIFGVRVYGYMSPAKTDLMNGLTAGLTWLPWAR